MSLNMIKEILYLLSPWGKPREKSLEKENFRLLAV